MSKTTTPLEEALAACTAEGNIIRPPARDVMTVDPKTYGKLKKLLTDNLAKWKGGKLQHFVCEGDAAEFLSALQRGEKPSIKRDNHFFPTPAEVVDAMCNMKPPLCDGRFLEPSAGRGDLIEGIMDFGARHHDQHWDCVEIHPENRKILTKKGYNLVGEDFLEMPVEPVYDGIYANPPFRGIEKHVRKMPGHLVPGGTIAVIVPASFPDSVHREIAEQFESSGRYEVGAGAFKKSGTDVATSIITFFCKKS